MEKALKYAIQNGFSGRTGNTSTHLYATAIKVIAELKTEISILDSNTFDTTDVGLIKHIKDLNEVEKSIIGLNDIFING